jgi:hypothetical protein
MYVYIHIYMCIYIYIYTCYFFLHYDERDKYKYLDANNDDMLICLHTCIYIDTIIRALGFVTHTSIPLSMYGLKGLKK